MKICFYSSQPYDKEFFSKHTKNSDVELEFLEVQLNEKTVGLGTNADAVCVFVNDIVNRTVLEKLKFGGIKIVALRCAGFNNVDIGAAKELGIKVCRVPAYSPEGVAEHAVAMIMTLNRKTHKAYNRVREQNFSLNGLLGFNIYGKTVGVIGTGNIGMAFCKIMIGFGCRIIAFDLIANREMENIGVEYLPLGEIFSESDIISIHCPLNEQTKHLINCDSIEMLKPGCMLINTSRGGIVDTRAVITGLKSGKVGYLGIDVYEQEEKLFFRDLSESIIPDDIIMRLMSFPNVLITAHQGFFTGEAMDSIATTTLQNVKALSEGNNLQNKAALLA